MIDPMVLLTFVPASLALNLTPGADMMFSLGLGLRAGPRAAVAASAGISAGGLVHAFAAALGLSALLASWPQGFEIIRWLGVAYLLWLAVQALRAGDIKTPEPVQVGWWQAFRMGLWVSLTNPKVILFVLAFMPQFVDPARPVLPQFLIFGAILGLGGFSVNGGVGVLAGRVAGTLARWRKVLNRLSAGVFGVLALRLAMLERT